MGGCKGACRPWGGRLVWAGALGLGWRGGPHNWLRGCVSMPCQCSRLACAPALHPPPPSTRPTKPTLTHPWGPQVSGSTAASQAQVDAAAALVGALSLGDGFVDALAGVYSPALCCFYDELEVRRA